MYKKFSGILIVCLLFVGIMLSGCSSNVRSLPDQGREVVVKVEPGMHSKEIGDLLVANGLLPKDNYFATNSRLSNLDKSLQAGHYKFRIGMTEKELIETINKGAVMYSSLTIPEGLYVPQIGALLEKNELGSKDKFVALAKDYAPYEYMQTNDTNVKYKAEGFLFPSTYYFPVGATEQDIIKAMVDEFNRQLTQPMREQAKAKNMDIRTLVIKASLVEKEAKHDEDRPIIAAVFENRLRIEMPLQCDATVQYELGYAKFPLLFADLKIESPYNTYLHYGLPPGPIGNPGVESLKAVLNPDKNDYLFFVADKNGKYYYTKTFDEHQSVTDSIDLGY
mgnify:CR=1 FL=1